jgi:cyclopropane-fatty-acyl-phospholipid synthase
VEEQFMNQQKALEMTERGILPDTLVRAGIRRLLKQRLDDIAAADLERAATQEQVFLKMMREGPVADVPELANEQHYEVPAAFFETVLGDHRKYSCACWPDGVTSLDEAEEEGLSQTCEHAALSNGQRILELGCGWGSLSLFMARRYPDSQITAVSNSVSQGEFIRAKAADEGLQNISVITADMNEFEADGRYDRIVSVEMFEHMRNWELLMARISNWLKADGCFFMHIFVHRDIPYLFQDRGTSDWMSRHFFSGGMMPSADLPLRCQEDLILEQRWFWQGQHYEKTCNAWLQKMDHNRKLLWPLFEDTYGKDFAAIWWQRWRMFFMACAELFGYRDGNEWFVAHYRFKRRDDDETETA